VSKIAIKGANTGTGTFTIESPATNTDRTLTLPDDTGTVVYENASGNVGIGTSSPATALEVQSASGVGLTLNAVSGDGGINFEYNGTRQCYVGNNDADGSLRLEADVDNAYAGSDIIMTVDGSEAMRIDSSGNLLVNTTSETGTASGDGSIQAGSFSNTGASAGAILENNSSVEYVFRASTTLSGSSRILCDFYNPNGRVGYISVSGSSTAYNTSSDYRLKGNVVDLTDAITRVKSLAPKRFNFIADEDATTVDGFLAHEAQTVVPEAITGTHNEVDDEGNPVYQGIDQSKLVPLLTGALQEAIAKIETLETTVADLQTRVTALEATP